MDSEFHIYNDLFNTMELGVVYQDNKGKIIEANPAAEKILGLSTKQMCGLTSDADEWQAIKEDGSPFLGREHPSMRSLATGKPVKDVIMGVYNPKYKGHRWININSVPEFREDENRPFRVYSIFNDVTLLKKAQEESLYAKQKSEESEERFKMVIDNLPLGVIVIDLDGKILMVNEASSNTTGYSSEELLTMRICDLDEETEIRDDRKNIWLKLQHKQFIRIEVIHKRKDGIKYNVEVYINAVTLKGKPVLLGIIQDMTERKQAEMRLMESEIRFRTLFEQAADAVYLADIQGHIVDVNPQAEKKTGYTRVELLRMTVMDLDRNYPTLEKCVALWSQIKIGSSIKFESDHVKRDGSVFPVEINASAIELKGKKHILGFIRDITERKNAEKQLKLTQFGIEHTGISIFQVNDDGDIYYANKYACNCLGYSNEELGHLKIWDIDPNLDLEKWKKHRKKTREQVNTTIETCHRRKDGTEFPVEVNINFFQYKGENISFSFAKDITERKKAEKILEDSEKRFRSMIEHSSDIITLLDANGTVLYESLTLPNLTGYAPEERLGKSEFETIYSEDLPLVKKVFKFIATHPGSSRSLDFRGVKKDGSIWWIEGTATNLFNEPSVQAIVANYRDVTDRKKVEEALHKQNKEYMALNEELIESLDRIQKINIELEKAKEKAEESDRLKTAFLANMSHEIRTPMNGIMGFADLLKNPNLTKAQTQKYIYVIEQSGQRMLNIVDDLIDISKIEAGQVEIRIEETNINQLIDSLYMFFKPDAESKGLTLSCKKELATSDGIIKTDSTKINQVLTNLIKNALKYTEKGHIDFGYTVQNDTLQFYVEDTGIGIAPKLKKKIFERFCQGDIPNEKVLEGTGLGLSISKAYVETLGGRLWVESQPHKGSVFYFTLPYKRIKERSKKQAEKKKESKTASSRKITILIVEDDEISYLYLKEILDTARMKILFTDNGKKAIEIIKSNPEINLVLMDIKMPVMNGLEATKQIKKIRPELPVIAQTAFASQDDRYRSLEAGCDDFISKPIDKDLLNEMIAKYSKGKSRNTVLLSK